MAIRRNDIAVTYILIIRRQSIYNSLRLRRRKQPVTRKRHHQNPRLNIRKCIVKRPEILRQIEIIHRFRYIQITVRIETFHEQLPLMIQVRLDREFRIKIITIIVSALKLPPEFLMHTLFGKIRYMPDHPRHRKAPVRPATVFVFPIGKIRVVQYRVAPDCVKSYRLCAQSRSRSDRYRRLHKIRIFDRPLQNLHPAH